MLAAVSEAEVLEAVAFLRDEIGAERLVAEWGNIFVPEELKLVRREDIASDPEKYDLLFGSVFERDSDHRQSALYKVIQKHKPDIVVDCINTATAISYQNEFELALETKKQLDAVAAREGAIRREELDGLIASVKGLLIAQGIPQIARHILVLHRTLEESSVQIYVKVGTTGTGGMGLNIPYTHSEDKPSLTLLAKSAIGFAHTGLLFLMARTPGISEEAHGAIVKEVKPGAMIGFRRGEKRHVRLRGERAPATLVVPKEQPLGDVLELAQDAAAFVAFQDNRPLEIIGADTGENGFFSIGEFQAITNGGTGNRRGFDRPRRVGGDRRRHDGAELSRWSASRPRHPGDGTPGWQVPRASIDCRGPPRTAEALEAPCRGVSDQRSRRREHQANRGI